VRIGGVVVVVVAIAIGVFGWRYVPSGLNHRLTEKYRSNLGRNEYAGQRIGFVLVAMLIGVLGVVMIVKP
jgi:hypothetical protein